MKRIWILVLTVAAATSAHAGALLPGGVQLLCHRTANEDVPENTLESLEQAALLGCDVVEIDLRRTLDGKIVLNHDGFLERLTDGIGETEKSYYDDLRTRDAGSWMSDRFEGMRMPLFEDALRLARERDIRLILDIKTKGIGADVLRLVEREGMLQRVRFNGEWQDVKLLYPAANQADEAMWVQPGVTAEVVKTAHLAGKPVVANFSDNAHGMDLAGMKAAVAAGVDAINVDYPRLGADAVGRPVEQRLAVLIAAASHGESSSRSDAILELARYRAYTLTSKFTNWLGDADDHVSRAAAVALVEQRTPALEFAVALHSENADARANAAWALGRLEAPAAMLLPLLKDQNPQVLQETLLALDRAPGEVSAQVLLPLLSHPDPEVRGTAALALARHQPKVATSAIPTQLKLEMKTVRKIYDEYVQRGKGKLSPSEIATVTGSFRCQMKLVQAISMLKGEVPTQTLEEQAFRAGEDFSQMNGIVAAFQLWDRIRADPARALEALGSSDARVADHAEWMLVQGGPAVLKDVRNALGSSNRAVRERAIRIVAWQGDLDALATLRGLQTISPAEADEVAWAIGKIETIHGRTR
jgi:glycerophosphoryl diester phosphodiesterase/HEAT repeat protein